MLTQQLTVSKYDRLWMASHTLSTIGQSIQRKERHQGSSSNVTLYVNKPSLSYTCFEGNFKPLLLLYSNKRGGG